MSTDERARKAARTWVAERIYNQCVMTPDERDNEWPDEILDKDKYGAKDRIEAFLSGAKFGAEEWCVRWDAMRDEILNHPGGLDNYQVNAVLSVIDDVRDRPISDLPKSEGGES